MNAEEIVRRLRALLAIPVGKRPITIHRLEQISGVADNEIYYIVKNGRMQEKTRIRLERALTLVENDQLVIQKHPNRRTEISVRAPQPPQLMVRRVQFTEQGLKVRHVAVNPNAFPELDPLQAHPKTLTFRHSKE